MNRYTLPLNPPQRERAQKRSVQNLNNRLICDNFETVRDGMSVSINQSLIGSRIRAFYWYRDIGDLEWCWTALYPLFSVILPNFIALQVYYVTVVEDRPMCLQNIVSQLPLAKTDPRRSSRTVSLGQLSFFFAITISSDTAAAAATIATVAR